MKRRKKFRQKPPTPLRPAPPPPPKKLAPAAMAALESSKGALQMAAMRHELAATQHALLLRTLERDYEFVFANVQIQPDGTIMDMTKGARPRPIPPAAAEQIRKNQGTPAPKEDAPVPPSPPVRERAPEEEEDGAAAPAPDVELERG